MSFEGTFDEVPPSEVFRILGATGRTGILHVARGECRKQVVLDAGRWVFCSAGTVKEALGQYLVARSILSEQDLEQAMRVQRVRGCRLGAVVVSMGRIDEPALERLLAEKIRESIHEIQSWREGAFKFVEGQALGDRVPFRISAGWEEIVEAGARRIAGLERVRRLLPDLTVRLRIEPGQPLPRPLPGTVEEAVMRSVLQGDTPAQACERLPFGNADILLYIAGLVERGVLKVEGAGDSVHAMAATLAADRAGGLIADGRSSQALALWRQACSADPANRALGSGASAAAAGVRQRVRVSLGDPAQATLCSVSMERLIGAALTPGEMFIASCLDGELSVQAMTRLCPSGELDAFAAIDGLFRRGLLRAAILARPEPSAAAAVVVGAGAPAPARPEGDAHRRASGSLSRRPAKRRLDAEPGPGGR